MLKGTLKVGMTHANMEEDYMTIEVIDEKSGTQVIDIKASIADFAHCLFGHRMMPCEFKLTSKVVGLIRERKTIEIPLPKSAYDEKKDKKNYQEVLKSYEKQGWKGRVEDMENGHNRFMKNGEMCARVVFTRFVKEKK